MKIAFSGSHGTGKTTLVKLISEKYGIPAVTNVTRHVPPELRSTREGQFLILDSYIAEVSSLKSYVADRSVADICAYSLNSKTWSHEEVRAVLSRYKLSRYYPNLIFYLPIEFPIEDDGHRFVKDQDKVDHQVASLVATFLPNNYIIRGTVDERMAQISVAIDTFYNNGSPIGNGTYAASKATTDSTTEGGAASTGVQNVRLNSLYPRSFKSESTT